MSTYDDTAARAEAKRLADEIEAATKDYRKVFPEPHSLAPNLSLAVRALRLLRWQAEQEPTEAEVAHRALTEAVRALAEKYDRFAPGSKAHDLFGQQVVTVERVRDDMRVILDEFGAEQEPTLPTEDEIARILTAHWPLHNDRGDICGCGCGAEMDPWMLDAYGQHRARAVLALLTAKEARS